MVKERNFLLRSALGRRELFATVFAAEPPRMSVRTGRHGERVGLLGYGTMRLPTVDGGHANPWGENSSRANIDQRTFDAHIDYALERGVNYFDTSPAYCRGEAETVLGKALARHPRGGHYIATKLSNFAASQRSASTCRKMFETSLKSLQTDYIDFYLLHSVGSGGMETFRKRYIDNGIIPWLFEQKAKGRIRNLGWSYHGDPKVVEWLLERHDSGEFRWDFAQIQMNYVDWRHAKEIKEINVNAEYLYGELDRREIPVVVMEPLLGGRLARHNDAIAAELARLDPGATPASWAFRFCGSFPRVLTVLSGMTFREHLVENAATFSPLKPLSRNEFAALERAAKAYLCFGAIPCNRCNYCMPCPYGLDIPGLLSFMNRVRTERLTEPKATRREYARAVPDSRRRADRCIGCGRCNPHCPQSIDIPKAMDAIAQFMEDLI